MSITHQLICQCVNHYRLYQQHKDVIRLHPEDYYTLMREPESRINLTIAYCPSEGVAKFRGIPVVVDRTAPRIDINRTGENE